MIGIGMPVTTRAARPISNPSTTAREYGRGAWACALVREV
jgi:hypothetical protein